MAFIPPENRHEKSNDANLKSNTFTRIGYILAWLMILSGLIVFIQMLGSKDEFEFAFLFAAAFGSVVSGALLGVMCEISTKLGRLTEVING